VAWAARELEVRTGPRERQKDAVVSGVILEAANFRKAQAVAVETDEFVRPLRVTCEADLDLPLVGHHEASGGSGVGG
jgi:hypothetical protein